MNALAHNTTLLDNSILGSFLSSNSNGKEKDWESGFHYYGARYYWSEIMTGWLSVDPMADKYPGISPYAYCAWNPVRLVDPDGEDIIENDDEWKYNTTTKRLTWVNDNGGKDCQTVQFIEGKGNREITTHTVSYIGQIQDMFDFSVFSKESDRIIEGGLQTLGGLGTIVGGLGVGVGSSGFAAPAGTAMVVYGGYQFTDGLKNLLEGIFGGSSENNYEIQDFVKQACKTIAIDASSMVIAQTMTEDVLKKGLSKVGNLIKGYGTLGLDAGWLAAGYAKTIFPKLKSQLPEGAKITKPNNRIGAGVGLIPH